MTDEEYHEIISKLNANGFVKVMTDYQYNVIKTLCSISATYDLDPIPVINTFADNLKLIAERLDKYIERDEPDDQE